MKLKLLLLTLSLILTVSAKPQSQSKPQLKGVYKSIKLTTLNTVVMRGPIRPYSVSKAQEHLLILDLKRGAKKYPLFVVVKSPGGNVDAAIALASSINATRNTHTISVKAYSAGAFLIQLAAGRRFITASGTIMFHAIRLMFPNGVNIEELEKRLAAEKEVIKSIETLMSLAIGISYEEYKVKTKEDWYTTGIGAVNAGTADEVVKVKCSAVLKKKKVEYIKFTNEGPELIQESGCPL